jgi:hypothetical protein
MSPAPGLSLRIGPSQGPAEAPSRAGPVQRLAASLRAVRGTGSFYEGWGGRGPLTVGGEGSFFSG